MCLIYVCVGVGTWVGAWEAVSVGKCISFTVRGRGEKNKKEKKIQKKDKTFLSYPKNLVKKYKPVKNEITYNWKETN